MTQHLSPELQALIQQIPLLMRIARGGLEEPATLPNPDPLNQPLPNPAHVSDDDMLKCADVFLAWLESVTRETNPALTQHLTPIRKMIEAWRSYGPEGPFTPVPNFRAGPGAIANGRLVGR